MKLETLMREPEMTPGHVAMMAFMSSRLPAAMLGEQLAASLCAESGESVVLVRLTRPANGDTTTLQRDQRLTLKNHFVLPAELLRMEGGFYFLNVGLQGELYQPERIPALVEQLCRRFRHVLVEVVAGEMFTPALIEFLSHSESGYFFVQAASEDVYQLDLLLRESRPRLAESSVHLKPVLCLRENEKVDGYDTLIRSVAGPVHHFIRGCPDLENPTAGPTGSFNTDIRRMAREIGSCLVGLALSSGAAKGLSHIGVIQVLEENGIEVDVVAGSSMGAYIGAIWAFGHDGQHLEKLAREMESPWALWSLIDPAFPPRQGFVRGVAVKRRLMKSIGNIHFAELLRPLQVMATNLETLESVAFCTGEVATAVHASSAVPGICVPVKIDGETYIDGGIVDPLPVDVLRELGVGRIIAVNAIPTADRIRYCLQAEHELAQMTRKHAREVIRKWIPLDQHLNYFARGNILEILMRSIHGAQIRMAESLGRQADLELRPEICNDRWLDYRAPGKFIKAGRQIAERYLAEIKALVARKAVANETALEPMAVHA